MALITLKEAVAHFGIPQETLEDWLRSGLLPLHRRPVSPPSGLADSAALQECVDEEQLADLAETIGWLQLSAEHWDNDEDA